MPFCPNPLCPHRAHHDRCAEYGGGVTHCGDCGQPLVAEDPTPPPPPAPGWPAPLKRRLWITVVLALGAALSQLVPAPLIDAKVLTEIMQGSWIAATLQTGPFSLGLLPILSGFVVVELSTLLRAGWRQRRHGDPDFRRRLNVVSITLGFGFALLQGFFIATWLESMSFHPSLQAYGAPTLLMDQPGLTFRLHLALAYAAGTGLWVAVALGISRFGVGSGFAVLIAVDLLTEAPVVALQTWKWFSVDAAPARGLLLWGLAFLALVAALTWILARPPKRSRGGVPLTLPTSGLWPLELASPLLLLPASLVALVHLPGLQRLVDVTTPGSMTFLYMQLGLVLLLTPLASWLYWWRYRARLRQAANAMAWLKMQLWSVALLLGLATGWHVLTQAGGPDVHIPLTALWTMALVAIAVDLWHEVLARRRAPQGADLVPLAAYQHPADALLDLETRDPDEGAAVQGLRYRSLQYFFAPYVPVRVLGVDPEPEPSDDDEWDDDDVDVDVDEDDDDDET